MMLVKNMESWHIGLSRCSQCLLHSGIRCPFDKLLIMLGNFHLELAFCDVIWTFNESEIEHLLSDWGILIEGSLVGFIPGKFYNRYVRVHDLLALVMARKLCESFLSSFTQEKRDTHSELISQVPDDRTTQESFLEASQVFLGHQLQ